MKNLFYRKMRKDGFTLVELLAVIVLIAIIIMIAVPSVTRYIESSRQTSYVRSAEGYIDGVKAMIASRELSMRRTDTTYYVPIECIDTDIGGESPYGDWVDGYVAVTYADSQYEYYWTSTDESGRGILLTYSSLLDETKIKSNILAVGTNIGIGDRDRIRVVDYATCELEDIDYTPLDKIEDNGAMERQPVIAQNEGDNISWNVSPIGWAQSKKVTIAIPNGYVGEYSLDGGINFKRYSNPITMVENGIVIARLTDGVYYVKGSSQSVTQVDTTAPTTSDFTYTRTSNSITVVATGTDVESGIKMYQFSKDDGRTWTDESASNTHTFERLLTGTYQIKVRVINGTYGNNGINNNYLDSETKSIDTVTINTPTYQIEPSGWTKEKTITIGYPSGYNNQYSLDGGATWSTYSSPIKRSTPGSIIARVNDGVNYVSAATQSIIKVDPTIPTLATFAYSRTSNSIRAIATGTDNESGIKYYQYSIDNGASWTSATTSSKYTFSNLATGTYPIKVRVINGTYDADGLDGNYLDSETQNISTVVIPAPTYTVTPTGWAQSKTVTISYPSGYTNEYSLDGGVTWKSYSSPIVLTKNSTVIARVNDGTNYVSGASQTVTQIDTTAPTAANFSYTRTSNSIRAIATGTDNESGIYAYQYSIDNGASWTGETTSSKYTFSNLATGTYSVKVRVINGTYGNNKISKNYLDSKTQNISTVAIPAPTYTVAPTGWAQSKTVTISYPSGYTNQYSLDGGVTWKSYSSPIVLTKNSTVIARVNDGTNYVSGASQTVTQIDTTAPTAASFTYTKTESSIRAIATGTDNESGIYAYQYSIDNGASWTSATTSSKYTFSNLAEGTYPVKVRVINGTYGNNKISKNYKDSATTNVQVILRYPVSLSVSEGGTASISRTSASTSESINVSYTAKTGYQFKSITATNATVSGSTVTPNGKGNVTITVTFELKRKYLFKSGEMNLLGNMSIYRSINPMDGWSVNFSNNRIYVDFYGTKWGGHLRYCGSNTFDFTGWDRVVFHFKSIFGSTTGGDYGPTVGFVVNTNIDSIIAHFQWGNVNKTDYYQPENISKNKDITKARFCIGYYVNNFDDFSRAYVMRLEIQDIYLEAD